MSYDLKLDACGDLAIENGDFVLINGKAEVIQRIMIYLQTWLSGYFYDELKGIDYKKVFTKSTTNEQIKSIFRKVVKNVDGVDSVYDIILKEYDPQTRNISIQIFVIIDGELANTLLEYTGDKPETCSLDLYLPKYLGDLIAWFEPDTNSGLSDNLADWPGVYWLNNDAIVTGSSNIDVTQKAIVMPNPLGSESNYLSWQGVPAMYGMENHTIACVLHIDEIDDSQEQGLFYTRGLYGGNPCSYQLLFDGPTQFTVRHDANGTVSSRNFVFSAFENTTMRLIISCVNSVLSVFVDGVLIDIVATAYPPNNTRGEGRVGVAADYQGNLTDTLNCQLGTFLMYSDGLNPGNVGLLDSWIKQKWNL